MPREDLQIILKDYERNKKAAKLLPLHEQKITELSGLNDILTERINIKSQDSILLNRQVDSLNMALRYCQEADAAEQNHAKEWKSLFEQARKGEARARRNTVFVGIVSALLIGWFAAK